MKKFCNVKSVMCKVFICAVFCFSLHITPYTLHSLYAEEKAPAQEKLSSGDLTVKAWQVHGKKDEENFKLTLQYTQQLIDLYKIEADKTQAALKTLPRNRPDIESVQILNDVGTAYFIQGECFRDQKKNEEAIKVFKVVVDKYYYAQAWDPRGWFWSVSRASRESILKLNPKESLRAPFPFEVPAEVVSSVQVSQLVTKINLYDSGKEDFINYEKYGEFTNAGTKDYRYVIKDQAGLSLAAGEGVYPNTTSLRSDPEYKKAQKEKRLEGNHWDFVHAPDLEAAFLKWAMAPEPQGVKLFYTGLMLEKSGLITQAVKCYYAVVVHFPGSYGWTYWHTPWYIGQAAIAKINYLLKRNPQLGYKLQDADIRVINGFDNDISNDIVMTEPGRFVRLESIKTVKGKKERSPTRDLLGIKKRSGTGKVHFVQYENGDWKLMADGKPYIIKAVTYAPTKVGQSPDEGTQVNWMQEDNNKNDIIDAPYEAFVDKNKNNIQDKSDKKDQDEPGVGDFSLMQDMGVNTIRLYHQPFKVNKVLLRNLYEAFGIRVIMGDFLGKYALGSGAPWYPGTDYNNPQQKQKMLQSVREMVLEFKDEPFVLFWLLGNENVYGLACNADREPDAYFKFANEVAKEIKALDPEHPVAICSGDILYLDKFGQDAPDIDAFGANAYRGDFGFGSFWQQVKQETDKPAFITEFGCPAYIDGKGLDEAEDAQAQYHRGSWEDIADNMAFASGAGNAVGGIVFEWLDEWWKGYEPKTHDTKGLWKGPFPDGTMHEEWLGVCSQGDGKSSPFLRQLRKSYYMYQKLWK